MKRGKILKIVLMALIIIIFIIYVFLDNNRFVVSEYTVSGSEKAGNIRIVLLTDLHNSEFGRDNHELVDAVKNAKPDIIAMAGDMNIQEEPNKTEVVCDLCNQLLEIAPIYYSLGNHELASRVNSKLLDELDSIGVNILDDEYTEIKINETEIVIAGMTEYPSGDHKSVEMLKNISNIDKYKILLCHYPEYFMWGADKWNVDLILSGHAHGGQIVIPFIGGLYAPEQGYFPKYVKGVFTSNRNSMVVSSGLGYSGKVPRINNPPELVVIDAE